MNRGTTKRVLLVEDEPRVARVIQALLVGTGALAVRLVTTSREAEQQGLADIQDVAIVDLGLPDGDGVDLIAKLHLHGANRPILALTAATDPARILASIRAGAAGYLFKDDIDARLVAAVAELCSGGSPLSAGAAALLVRHVHAERVAGASPRLTPREKAVLELLAIGAGYTEIASETGTSINTVRTHVRATYEKLGVQNRAEAINLAWRLGLLRREA